MSEQKHTLLIVDDIAANRAVLSRRFLARGYRVIEADCGRDAIELVGNEAIDLVLLDVMMPDINGLEVLETIRKRFSPIALPIVMVTAVSESGDIVKALKLGANDYVTKPVDFAVASARVEAHIGRKKSEEAVRVANQALSRANDELERRVQARTAELQETNEQLVREMADRQRSEAKVRFLAEHDALTGLSNRAHLCEFLDQVFGRLGGTDQSVAVLCIGLDRFKDVNDTLGYAIGDELLFTMARRLREAFRGTDIIARLGGDKFAIVQGALKRPEDASAIAERLIGVLRDPYEFGGQRLQVGGSVGISVWPADGTDADQLLRNADLALSWAKSDGRGNFRFFEEEMDRRARGRRALQLDLQNALENGELDLHYQPAIEIGSRKIRGFEALLRWKHPRRGMISPAEFIPVAEDVGLIGSIGEWVLRRACADAASWPVDLCVAVNLSPMQFRDPHLAQTVVSALEASGLPAERLEIEITESVPLRHNQIALATLHRIRQIGVCIALDDFGTGYSSLAYLQSFPFDKIKIDQSFVQGMSLRADCATIVRAVAGLGRSLGLKTTAEGVETFEQLQQLDVIGCNEVQGFLFGQPMPSTMIQPWLDAFRKAEARAQAEEARKGAAA